MKFGLTGMMNYINFFAGEFHKTAEALKTLSKTEKEKTMQAAIDLNTFTFAAASIRS